MECEFTQNPDLEAGPMDCMEHLKECPKNLSFVSPREVEGNYLPMPLIT
jgi:hypothetical protein